MTEPGARGVAEATGIESWLKWIDRFSILLAVIGGAATVALMLNIAADVVGRFLYRSPLAGTLDFTQYVWMPTLVSLGLGYALLREEHVRVSLLTAPTGPRVQRAIEVVGMASVLGMAAMFIWFGTAGAATAMDPPERAIGTPWLAIWPSRWAIVIGMAGLLLQSIAQVVRALTQAEFRPTDDEEEAAALIAAEATVFDELEPSSPTQESTDKDTLTAARREGP